MFREGWATQLRRQEGLPYPPTVTSEALEQGHGEFRDIPYLSWQKEGQNIEESWDKGRKKIPFKEQMGEGAVRGRKRRQRLRAGDRKIPDWYQR